MKVRPLSIYLLKTVIERPEDAIASSPSVQQVSIGHGRGAIGTLFYRSTPTRPPRWVNFFDPHVNRNDFKSSSSSAVLIVRTANRLFAVTFGHGRYLLEAGSYEEQFGLRVTLNSVSPDEVRTIDRRALDATGRHSRDQASKNIPIMEFGLDIDKDILLAVTGPPEDKTLGRRLSGADALSVVFAEVELSNLRELLQLYLIQYRKRRYRDRFPWVDNIREVGDQTVSDDLDGELARRIQSRTLHRIWMAVPDLVDWHDVGGFTYSVSRGDTLLDDIAFDSYLNVVGDADDITIEHLCRHRVICISAETDLSKAEWSIYKCVYAEIDRHGKTFLLTGGRWYEVDSEYVEQVNRAIDRIPSSLTLNLPICTESTEEDYNRRVRHENPRKYALMDRRMIRHGGGSSQIEFCDLYTNRREMVHVKRYGGSGTLSHLFAQGMVSATLFLSDLSFRKAVNKLLPSTHKLGSTEAQPRTTDYEVSYAIASNRPGRLDLPFFSRVTLRSAHTQLRNMDIASRLTKSNVPRLQPIRRNPLNVKTPYHPNRSDIQEIRGHGDHTDSRRAAWFAISKGSEIIAEMQALATRHHRWTTLSQSMPYVNPQARAILKMRREALARFKQAPHHRQGFRLSCYTGATHPRPVNSLCLISGHQGQEIPGLVRHDRIVVDAEHMEQALGPATVAEIFDIRLNLGEQIYISTNVSESPQIVRSVKTGRVDTRSTAALTATKIIAAINAGADVVKVGFCTHGRVQA